MNAFAVATIFAVAFAAPRAQFDEREQAVTQAFANTNTAVVDSSSFPSEIIAILEDSRPDDLPEGAVANDPAMLNLLVSGCIDLCDGEQAQVQCTQNVVDNLPTPNGDINQVTPPEGVNIDAAQADIEETIGQINDLASCDAVTAFTFETPTPPQNA